MRFKKHISLFLAFFLLVSNLGMALNVHYCDDEIASVSINSIENTFEIEKDCCGEVEKDSKCCNTKLIKSNEKSEQIVAKTFSFEINSFCVFNEWRPIVFASKFNFKERDFTPYYCDANAPPFYLLYSQYTFYS